MLVKKYFIALVICFQWLQSTAKDYPVSLFGISSDGVTLNTRSIQFAIDYVHQQGVGRLVFDVGRFLTGTIHLKSNVTLVFSVAIIILPFKVNIITPDDTTASNSLNEYSSGGNKNCKGLL